MALSDGILSPDVPPVRVVAWELTRACNLSCPYCRAAAGEGASGETATGEALRIVEEISTLGRPLLILTGGEPLLRGDLQKIAAEAAAKGLRVVVASNGTLISRDAAQRLGESGVRRVSVSLDYPDAARHDGVRGAGSFEAAMEGIDNLREAGVAFQVNMTVTRENAGEMEAMLALAEGMGAKAFHLFFVVNVGRALERRQGLAPVDYEKTLTRAAHMEEDAAIEMRVTCAPQYRRIRRSLGLTEEGGRGGSSGCMAGRGFLFISATGEVKPCGYFDLVVGRVGEQPLASLWAESPVLGKLRKPETLEGRCGICMYAALCGGCRARAYAATGNFLSEDPVCLYDL